MPELNAAFPTSTLADVLEPKGAQVIARHVHDFYAGKPAATLNHFGKGKAIYLGALGDGAYYETVARWSASLAGINPLLETPAGVEVVERWQREQKIVFILNHTAQPQIITLKSNFTNLLTDQTIVDEINIEPLGVLLLTP
jgi:beta-galactosidase